MVNQKLCTKCGSPGPFSKNQSWCKACANEHAAKKYAANPSKYLTRSAAYRADNKERYRGYDRASRERDPGKNMWKKAQQRAKRDDIPFNIEPSDIIIPEFCPLLGERLEYGVGVQNRYSPTLDRKNPELGYVKGNVLVISYKANAMKQDATRAQLELFAENILAHIADGLL